MKKNVLQIGILATVLLVVASCKDEKKEQAEKTVNNYVVYVDSLANVSSKDTKSNWKAIDASYQQRVNQAEKSIADVKDNDSLKQKLEASKIKYDALKAKYQEELNAEKAKAKAPKNPNQLLRDRFFGEGKIGEDMNFSWVNKDNILKVYDEFFKSYKDNKSSFSREDYDETKLIYEALDSRKNTVEKEGLSSSDNMKIASIKFKFAPMFKINRMGAKARENKEAKE